MICPKCGAASRVLETRAGDHLTTKRRRQCEACAHRFVTVEILSTAAHIVTIRRAARKVRTVLEQRRIDIEIAARLHENGGRRGLLLAQYGFDDNASLYRAARRGRAYAAQVRHPLRPSRR